MKQKLLLAIFALLLLSQNAYTQTKGYIYIHNKSINEASSTDFTCNITGGTTTVPTFILNDVPDYLNVGDIGASRGTGGDGELWAISNGASALNTNAYSITGNIYHRSAGTANWTNKIAVTASAVDGAGAGTCVYIAGTGTNNVFYYNGTSSVSLGFTGTATDISYANGKTAVVSGGGLYYFSGTTAAPTTGAWNQLTGAGTGNGAARIDLKSTADSLWYVTPSTTTIKKIPVNTAGTAPTSITISSGAGPFVNGSTGSVVSGLAVTDIAVDDNGIVYVIAGAQYTVGASLTPNIVFQDNNGVWTEEGEGRGLVRLTGGPGGQMWGTASIGFADAIWARASDNIGSHVWLDDERVRTNIANGNSIIIPVDAGTYTFTETLPSGYDLGRFNIYDPTGNTSGTPFSNTVTINVSAGETVNVEVFNEKLNSTTIALNCTTSTLQTFGGTSASASFGSEIEGTSYHYANSTSPQDGYYMVVKQLASANWFTNALINDHTTNTSTGGYFLVVNAAYAKDEFYRQRVTGLKNGVQYTISFWTANALNANPIKPDINFGLQDAAGVILDSSSISGQNINLSTNGTWTFVSFTFTATTTTGDLYLRNNNIGGFGNDICIDDIALNPVVTTVGANTISPDAVPNLCIGATYRFSNTLADGTWSSSNTSVANINSSSGVIPSILAAGSTIITYTYINQSGCSSTASDTLTAVNPPTITAADKFAGALCKGSVDSLIGTSNAASPTYLWSTTSGPATPTIANTAALSTTTTPSVSGAYIYQLYVKDGTTGCTATATVNITVSASTAPTISAAASKTFSCLGKSDGTQSVTLTASRTGGGTLSGTETYTWSGSSATFTPNSNHAAGSSIATPTATGIFTVVVDNGGGCKTLANTSTVTADPAFTVTPAALPSAICKNQSTTLSANAAGGTTSYTYAWSRNGTAGYSTNASPTFSPGGTSGSNTFAVTATDALGCKATGSVVVVVGTSGSTSFSITSITSSPNTSVCAGTPITLTTAQSGGSGTINYTWTGPTGTVFSGNGATYSSPLTSTTAAPETSGNFVVNAVDGNGCGATLSKAVTVLATPSITSATATPPTLLCNGGDIPLNAVATGTGTLVYTWSTVTKPGTSTITYSPNGTSGSNNSVASVAVSLASTGSYQFAVTVSDGSTCTRTANTPVYNILGSNIFTAPTLSGTTATATIATGTSTSNGCFGGNILLSTTRSGGTQGLTGFKYTWTSPVAVTYAGGTLGTNGGTYNTTTTATINATPSATGSGTFTVSLIDGNGCTASDVTSLISINALPTVTANIDANRRCYLGVDSLIDLIGTAATNGSATSLTYLWTSAQSYAGIRNSTLLNTTAKPTGTGSVAYTITATDNLGCSAAATSTTATVYATPTVTATATPPATLCQGQTIGLTASVSGGAANYDYVWAATENSTITQSSTFGSASSTNNATATTDSAGSFLYTVLVTDGNGCKGVGQSSLTLIKARPVITVSANKTVVCVTPASTVTLTTAFVTQTISTYTYSWSGSAGSSAGLTSSSTTASGISSNSASPTASGTYSVTVTDSRGCVSDAVSTATVTVGDPTIATLTSNKTSVCANPSSSVNLTATLGAGTTPVANGYAWSGTGVTANLNSATTTATPTTTNGTFQLKITDANSCTATKTVTVTVDQATPSTVAQNCGRTAGGIPYVQLFERDGVSWTWATLTGGQRYYTDNALSPSTDSATSHLQGPYVIKSAIYNVTITNSAGCIGSGPLDVTVSACGTVLPVSLLDFTAQKAKDNVQLTWGTAAEVNSDYFGVERSINGYNWQTIGTVKAHGNSSIRQDYKFLDEAPNTGINYYRLRQVDADGKFAYSEVRTVDFTNKWLVHMYPNPATDYLVIEVNSEKEEKGSIVIQTALGSTIFIKEQTLSKGLNIIRLNQIQPLAQGSYIVTLATKNNIYRSKFVKGGK